MGWFSEGEGRAKNSFGNIQDVPSIFTLYISIAEIRYDWFLRMLRELFPTVLIIYRVYYILPNEIC